MRTPRALLATLSTLILAALLAACGSGSAEQGLFPKVIPLGKGDLFPYVNNTSLAVGENRVSISLIDRDDRPVLDAEMRLAFYDLNGKEPVLRSEADARFVPIELSYVGEHIHADGTHHSHGDELTRNTTGEDGVYVATATFDRAGHWGVLIDVTTSDGESHEPIPYRFTVRQESPEPAIGEPAPPSRQRTLADVGDVSEIDSSYPPQPEMHDVTVADALAGGRPLVIFFGTPAFCETRTCNPVMETVMDPLAATYGDRVEFIHIEPYELPLLREQNVREHVHAMAEWGLSTEPWLFVVDAEGRVAAKYEGAVAASEVEDVLRALLPEAAAGGAADFPS